MRQTYILPRKECDQLALDLYNQTKRKPMHEARLWYDYLTDTWTIQVDSEPPVRGTGKYPERAIWELAQALRQVVSG